MSPLDEMAMRYARCGYWSFAYWRNQATACPERGRRVPQMLPMMPWQQIRRAVLDCEMATKPTTNDRLAADRLATTQAWSVGLSVPPWKIDVPAQRSEFIASMHDDTDIWDVMRTWPEWPKGART